VCQWKTATISTGARLLLLQIYTNECRVIDISRSGLPSIILDMMSDGTSFSYNKFVPVRETGSHVIEMLRCYWSEVRVVSWRKYGNVFPVQGDNTVHKPPLAWLHMQLVYKFLADEFLVRETWTFWHRFTVTAQARTEWKPNVAV